MKKLHSLMKTLQVPCGTGAVDRCWYVTNSYALAQLGSMVQSSAVPMVGLTRDGIVESWNAAAESLFGYGASEIIGQHVALLGSCDDRQEQVDTIRCVRGGGVVRNLETVRIAKDGGKIPVLLTVAPIKDEVGAVVGMSASIIDITRSKRAELALKDADQRKDEFLATLAHELRNPLWPMRNAVHILHMSKQEPARVEQAVSILDRQLQHMVRLIDDLLDVARISRGKMKLRCEPMDLRTALACAVETSRPLIEAQHHDLEVVQPQQTVMVDGDLTRLAQIVSNLLNNAARYTPTGGHIRLSLKREGAEAILSVSDNGIGISHEALPRLFTMFSQVDRQTTRGERGLGIGLALVRALVEMHGGRIEATSAGPGQGATFAIRLPIAEEHVQANPKEVRTRYDILPLRVLVADDNQDAADSTALALELAGHQVKVVHDGGAAVEAASSFRPDVILMDAGMPVLDGYEATRRIRAQEWGRDLVIFAVTGWGQDADREESRQAGCNGHLVKPVDMRDLESAIASAIWRIKPLDTQGLYLVRNQLP
jgi:PAS domain S-box-containing protein